MTSAFRAKSNSNVTPLLPRTTGRSDQKNQTSYSSTESFLFHNSSDDEENEHNVNAKRTIELREQNTSYAVNNEQHLITLKSGSQSSQVPDDQVLTVNENEISLQTQDLEESASGQDFPITEKLKEINSNIEKEEDKLPSCITVTNTTNDPRRLTPDEFIKILDLMKKFQSELQNKMKAQGASASDLRFVKGTFQTETVNFLKDAKNLLPLKILKSYGVNDSKKDHGNKSVTAQEYVERVLKPIFKLASDSELETLIPLLNKNALGVRIKGEKVQGKYVFFTAILTNKITKEEKMLTSYVNHFELSEGDETGDTLKKSFLENYKKFDSGIEASWDIKLNDLILLQLSYQPGGYFKDEFFVVKQIMTFKTVQTILKENVKERENIINKINQRLSSDLKIASKAFECYCSNKTKSDFYFYELKFNIIDNKKGERKEEVYYIYNYDKNKSKTTFGKTIVYSMDKPLWGEKKIVRLKDVNLSKGFLSSITIKNQENKSGKIYKLGQKLPFLSLNK